MQSQTSPFFTTFHPRQKSLAREQIEMEIERLIDLLDQVDGDADFEANLGGRALHLNGKIECDLELDYSEADADLQIEGGGYRL